MANLDIQNNDTVGIVIWEPVYEKNTLTAGAAETWPVGTVLGRISASGKLTRYASGAGDGSEVPKAVLAVEEIFAGAGDTPARVIIAGRLRRADLTEFGVGAITVAQADQLRDYSIISLETNELTELDNQ